MRAKRSAGWGLRRVPTTPNLERLARDGARVDHAYAPMPTTLPSHATMMTSKPPMAHGLLRNGFVLPPEHTLLADILQEVGYRTAAFVSSHPLDRRFGLSRGFEIYDDDFGADQAETDSPPTHRDAGVTTDRAVEWLEENGEVAYTDQELGRLVDTLDRVVPRERSLLIVTADHGEGLNDHGFVGHGPILYEETVRVPLIFRWAGTIPEDVTLSGRLGSLT